MTVTRRIIELLNEIYARGITGDVMAHNSHLEITPDFVKMSGDVFELEDKLEQIIAWFDSKVDGYEYEKEIEQDEDSN